MWVDGAHPLLLVWRSRSGSVAALAVTGKHLADEWLGAGRGQLRDRNGPTDAFWSRRNRRSSHRTRALLLLARIGDC